MNNFTKPFKNLSKNDTNIAGGKGASLGEMINSGITVPDGFVVLSSTFDEFIKQTDLIQEIEAILDSVDHKVIHTVDKASDKIRELIISREIPEGIKNEIMQSFKILGSNFVAVRSSATAEDGSDNAWAGQLESYLNVTEKDVLEKVKKCWSSLFTARAIFYRFEKDLQLTKISVAVVVQKMINSEKSGIAFTVHPVTEDRNQMIIEAGYGLGEAIVSGSVTPDSYVISKEPYKIVDLNIGYQDKALFRSKEGENEWIDLSEEKAKSQVLSEEEIYKLGEIILEIENHYGFPCDIEWAFEKGNFYIVQSRPITTLKNKSAKGKIELEKVFSMDKSLMYMFMWNITDGAGFKKFINFEAKNTFFIFDSKIKKTYVWYDLTERKEISRILNNSISSDKYFSKKIIETLDKNWKIVSPFLAGKVEIKTKEEIKLYYEGITNWWSAMNTVYPLINAPSASKKELDLFLKYREKTEKYTGKMDELLMDFFIKNLPKHKDMVEYLTFTEAIDLIDKKNSRLISEVKKRKEGFFICHGIVYPQDKMEEILNKNNLLLKEKIEISENVIKGVVAFCGKTSGLVRKVIKKEDISNFKEGEILVAETTYPDHVPIMQKAAAFVTDEGGITCHAAIVARELKKPCIIGTKIATQVLKDGDLVEVDADNGVVRILERKDKNLIDSRKTATLVKYFSRDHSLFYIYLWRASNCEKAIDWLDKNWHEVLYVRPQGQEEVDVWYSDKEMDQYRRDIESHIKNDPNWFPLITNYFEERWNQIFKFIKKNPQTHDEFKKFTSLWLEWWEPMAIMMQAPEATSLPKELSKHAFDLRAKTQEYSDQADVIYKKYIQHTHPELAKYHSVLLPQEVIDDKFPDSTVLEERLGGWFLTDDTFDSVSCLDETLKEKKLILHKDIHGDSNNLSGQTAYQGIICGTAKIVKKQSDLDKVLVGDILISPMTTPDFIPAMQKAAAFVTDEGGITCHAAIVARELKKPCIIGTKIATQVLKDGDLVEVDADNGVVRILKNTNKESDITEEILSTEWYHLGKWIEPALAAEIWLEYASVAQQFFKNVLDKKILYLNGDFLLSKHDSDIFQNEAYEAAKNHNIQFFEHIYKTVKDVSLDISTKSKKINSVSGFLEEYKMLTGVWMPLNNVALGIERYVQEINSKAFEFTKGFLDEKPMILMQIDEMIVLKNKIEKTIGKKLEYPEEIPEEHKKEIEIHIKKYEWLGSHHFNIGKLNIANLVQRMKEVKKEDSKKLLNNSDKELEYLVWLLDLIGYARFKPAETSGYATYNLKDKLQNIAEKKGLDYEDIVEHTIEEISSKNISKDIAKQRRLYTGFYFNGLKYSLDKDQINACVGGLLKTEENNTLEIKGISAQKGKVSGFVKIVNKQNQSDGFEPGMIVVSHETTPDIICVMQKSGAIVTDFGGLTSHAAIVARELKKPCIVGTKIATQVLKDGDFVEVDADNGVIKIIK